METRMYFIPTRAQRRRWGLENKEYYGEYSLLQKFASPFAVVIDPDSGKATGEKIDRYTRRLTSA